MRDPLVGRTAAHVQHPLTRDGGFHQGLLPERTGKARMLVHQTAEQVEGGPLRPLQP